MKKEYHFIKELREQPEAVRVSLESTESLVRELAREFAGSVRRVLLVGCGDPYMLGIPAALALEAWARVPAEAVEAAEFAMYRYELVDPQTLVVLISSSGKTVKVIDAARLTARRGGRAFALTNRVPSPITEEVDMVVQTQAGWSDSFPTKQTTSALGVLYHLALAWGEAAGALAPEAVSSLQEELFGAVPRAMEAALGLEGRMKALAERYLDAPMFTFVGSGPNLATALLGAAKMKETSQSRADACNLEEYGHLHALSLADGDSVFLLTRPGQLGERNRSISRYISEHGGGQIVVGPPTETPAWRDLPVDYVEVPQHSEMFGPLVALLPLQMFAYYVAIAKGRNPDRPPERGEIGYLQKIIYTSVLEGWEDR